jgi:t-SNARE complex subunit (syntaxin)
MSDVFDKLRRRDVRGRLAALEAEVQEQRQLSRRVAELTDLVTDLLVPLAERDHDRVEEIVDRYRASI